MSIAHYQRHRLALRSRWCRETPGRRCQSCFIAEASPRDVAGKEGSMLEEGNDLPIKSCQLGREVAGPCGELLSENARWAARAAARDGKLAQGKTQGLVNYTRKAGDQREGSRRCIFLFIYFLFSPTSTQYPSNSESQMDFILTLPCGVGTWPNVRGAKEKSRASDLFAWGHKDRLTQMMWALVQSLHHEGMLSPKEGSWSATCWYLFEKKGLRIRKTLIEEREKFHIHTENNPLVIIKVFHWKKIHYYVCPHAGAKLGAQHCWVSSWERVVGCLLMRGETLVR